MGVLTLGISAFDVQFRNQEDALHFAVFYTSDRPREEYRPFKTRHPCVFGGGYPKP